MTAANRFDGHLRRRLALAGALAMIGLGWATNAAAQADPAGLTVVNRETGQPLPVWRWHGRLFVAGEPGARYSLRVANHTGGRVMLVMSVDGLNILTGETAGYDQNGYVLHPYESYDATGWRKSDNEVAAFAFAPLPKSYAARTGRPADVGVIGMAVFEERPQVAIQGAEPPSAPPSWLEGLPMRKAMPRRAVAVPAPPPPPAPLALASPSSAMAESADVVVTAQRTERLGTAHGAREWSTITHTAFDRATPYPRQVIQIEYDTHANLVARGVIPREVAPPHRPRPFPSTSGEPGYVPDPPPEP